MSCDRQMLQTEQVKLHEMLYFGIISFFFFRHNIVLANGYNLILSQTTDKTILE